MPTIAFLAFAFLSPAFALSGLALASIPILIHLLNRRRHRTMNWAAMDLLMRAVQQTRRRVRFEHWLLLATRCLLLVLMGLALARPMGCDDLSTASMGGRTGLTVLVIDNSYSMAYLAGRPGGKTHLDQAKMIAGQIIDRLSPGGESVAIITAGKPAAGVIAKPTYDLQQAKAILGRIPQSYGATDLATAMKLAIDIGHEQEREPNKNLYLLTDATTSAWQGADAPALKSAGPELARLFHISHSNLSTGPQWNQAVLDLHPSASLITTNSQFGADFIATVKGFGSTHDATLQWTMDGKLLAGGGKLSPDINTPPQVEAQSNLQQAIKSGGAHAITATLLNEDGLQVDNARTKIINVVSQLKTLIVEGQHGAGTNLRVALAGLSKSGQSDGFAAPDLISDLELGNKVLVDYRAIILCGLTQFTPAEADQLKAFVSGGGALMIFLADNIAPDNYNDVLLSRHLMPGPLVKRVLAAEGQSFTFDFNPNGTLHPLLNAFAHQSDTGLETAQAFGYWQVDVPEDPQIRVLNWRSPAGAASPDAAITQQSSGQGRVVLITTSANEQWISFTRKPIYTELVNELLSGSVNVSDAWMNLTVGDRLIVPANVKLSDNSTLTDPKSVSVPLVPSQMPHGSATYTSAALTEPGIYTLSTGNGDLPVAVNVPPEEADVRTIDNAAIKTALGGIDLALNDDQPLKLTIQPSTRPDWGWTIMLLVLALIGFEAVCAKAFGHQQKDLSL
jgi:Mg-chelatase subunit ChlD